MSPLDTRKKRGFQKTYQGQLVGHVFCFSLHKQAYTVCSATTFPHHTACKWSAKRSVARPACWPLAIFQWLFLRVWSVPSSILTCVAEQPSSPACHCLCLRLKAFPRKCVYVHVASVPSSYTSHVTHWHSLYRIYCGHGTSQWRCAHGKERWYALLRRHWRCHGQFPRGRPFAQGDLRLPPTSVYFYLPRSLCNSHALPPSNASFE